MPFAPKTADQQGALEIGETFCDLDFRGPENQTFSFYLPVYYGWPKAILLAETISDAEPGVLSLQRSFQAFVQCETMVAVVTRSTPAEHKTAAAKFILPFPVLREQSNALHDAAGFHNAMAPQILFIDSNMRLERVFGGKDLEAVVADALSYAENRFQHRRPSVSAAVAPVLTVTNVLSPDHCQRLMRYWTEGDKQENMVTGKQAKSRNSGSLKVRSDVFVPAGTAESDELVEVFSRRLIPDIDKAFAFKPTRYEPFRVGCYDANENGHFAPHRDNHASTTAHRRFALVINLNTGDYQDGLLRLPEYGTQLLNQPAGAAVVFSCSLLHLATPVTKGRRFVLVGFFWGEEDQRLFEQTHAGKFPVGYEFDRIP